MSAPDTQFIEQIFGRGVIDVRQLLDAMPHMVWMATEDNGCEFVSRGWEQYTGLRADEQLGYDWAQVIHPEEREYSVGEWLRAAARGVAFQVNCRIRRHDGEYRWFDMRGVPLRNASGNIVKWFATSTDVHESFLARDALAQNEERLRYVELATHDCIYDWDMRAAVTRHNEAFRKLFGAPEVSPNDERWWERHIHPDDRKRVVDSAAAAFRARRPTWSEEYRFQRPDGSYATVVDRGYLLYDQRRKPLRMIGAVSDISERKKIEQSLRDAQGRLLSAMAAGGLGTWIWDIASATLIWDEATFRLWGREPLSDGKVSLRQIVDWIHPDDRSGINARISEFYQNQYPVITEFRTVRPDGKLQWLQARGQVQRSPEGQVVRAVGIYADITERKRTQEVQLRTQKMEALGTLAGGIAHDFNNILLAIAGNAKLALEDVHAGVQDRHALQRNLAEIEKASARAAGLVRRILTFSRQEEAQRAVMALAPIVDEALQLLRPTLPAAIEIRTQYAKDVSAVATDPIQIHQVVMNLVTNAAQAIGTRCGAIEIGVSSRVIDTHNDHAPPGHYVCLSIGDSGSGIDAAIVDRIFDPFFTTKPTGQGTGLGLAVVHGIVKAHGGAIEVESVVGKGTTFRVLLPAAVQAALPSATTHATAPRGAGEHVLYVDDEEALVYLVTRVLEKLGYRVTGFSDPQQAVAAFAKAPQEFDVVVTDLSMHTMTGFDLAQAMRAIRTDVPVLLTSGYLRNEDREMAERCGIRELILKPNTVEELGQAIDRELREKRP